MKTVDFEDYLQEKHSEQYIGLDDDMVDDFNDWLCDLDPQELIDYGQKFAIRAFEFAILKAGQTIDGVKVPSLCDLEWNEYIKEAKQSIANLTTTL